jgi:hypothetical protein
MIRNSPDRRTRTADSSGGDEDRSVTAGLVGSDGWMWPPAFCAIPIANFY